MVPGTPEGFRVWEGDIVLARGPLRVDAHAARETLELVRRLAAQMGPVPPDRELFRPEP